MIIELTTDIAHMAELAVSIVNERTGETIEFSLASLQTIEQILAEVSDFIPELGSDRHHELARIFGCYLLEIGYRQFGGKYYWHEDLQQPVLVVGEPEFHIAIVTWDKVRQRLTGDESDNIPFFFHGFVDRVRTATPGTHVLYV